MSDDGNTQSADGDLIRSLCDEARDLIKRVEGTSVQRVTVRAGQYEIDIDRRARAVAAAPAAAPPAGAMAAPVASVGAPAGTAAPEAAAAPVEIDNRHPILAPLVGTFYRSSQPGSKPFVEEGDSVEKGQPLCIVEAMKIMNQVTADRAGRVNEIPLKDGDMVEFQQVLMYLDAV